MKRKDQLWRNAWLDSETRDTILESPPYSDRHGEVVEELTSNHLETSLLQV